HLSYHSGNFGFVACCPSVNPILRQPSLGTSARLSVEFYLARRTRGLRARSCLRNTWLFRCLYAMFVRTWRKSRLPRRLYAMLIGACLTGSCHSRYFTSVIE